jgi:glycosyltransferase involved in cell wall biosynthesis
VKLYALDRDGSEPLTPEELAFAEGLIEDADVVWALKEQSLEGLHEILKETKPLVVSLHRSDPENQGVGPSTLLKFQETAKLRTVVFCAEASRDAYRDVGLKEELFAVIPNGIDLIRFQRDEVARAEVRESNAIPSEAPVVMIAARFDPMKNIPLFLQGASRLLTAMPDTHFILCGTGLTWANDSFNAMVDEYYEGPKEHLHPQGIVLDMERYYSATDVISLTSTWGEAAPLCLLEGMACGAVPVATAVGDTRLIVGNEGIIVDRLPAPLAAAWYVVISELPKFQSRVQARRDKLSNQLMISSYRDLFHTVTTPIKIVASGESLHD